MTLRQLSVSRLSSSSLSYSSVWLYDSHIYHLNLFQVCPLLSVLQCPWASLSAFLPRLLLHPADWVSLPTDYLVHISAFDYMWSVNLPYPSPFKKYWKYQESQPSGVTNKPFRWVNPSIPYLSLPRMLMFSKHRVTCSSGIHPAVTHLADISYVILFT